MPAKPIRNANQFLDERVGSQKFLESALNHIFPDDWSFMFGELALYCFLLLVGSGVYLTFFFDPSDATVVYKGSYLPLRGVRMTAAYQSVVRLSLDVRAGLLFRQIHHWSADLFLAAIVVHLCRIFFTGAYRKPRDLNWTIGLSLLLLSMFNGFTGYSLPDDLMSGLGMRIAYSIAESVPVIGTWLAYLLFGGQFPNDQVTHRLYLAHIMVIPALIFALLGLHLALIWRQKHTEFPGKGRDERTLVGSQLWPTYTARSLGLLCAVTGVVCVLSGVAQINPIWLYGPYQPASGSSFAQPDWYVGWLEGALRLFPAWRLHLFGYTVSEAFWPAVLFPMVTFAILHSWPWMERRLTSDFSSHNLLDRPRDRPVRTALGVGGITLYIVLVIAGAQDVLAAKLQVTQPEVTLTLRGLAICLPVLTGLVAWKLCKDLSTVQRRPETEPPKGPEDSATPPAERYLPVRASLGHVSAPRREEIGTAPAAAGGFGRGGLATIVETTVVLASLAAGAVVTKVISVVLRGDAQDRTDGSRAIHGQEPPESGQPPESGEGEAE